MSAPKTRGPDGTFYQPRRARRTYQCDRECGAPIPAGSTYVVASLPPGNADLDNRHWLTGRLHGRDFYDCPRYRPEREL